jgi:hypothetical protein
MKKLTKCNNIVITSLIIVGTFVLFFYLYVYGYKNEGFYNFNGRRRLGDYKNILENQNAPTYPSKPIPTNGTFHDCNVLTDYGQGACNNGVTMEHLKCKWNSSPTSYSGSSIQMSTGGICETI